MINLSLGVEFCPRCGGQVGWYVERRVGGQVYVYAVHYLGWDSSRKRPKKKECYLGPKGEYEYVSRLHEREGLTLKGLVDGNRALEYLEALVESLISMEPTPDLKRRALEIASRLEATATRLREFASRASGGGVDDHR